MATLSEERSIRGRVYPANESGLGRLMEDANDMSEKFRLVTVVTLGKTLAAIYETKPPVHEGTLV